jgi:hypothetical protein
MFQVAEDPKEISKCTQPESTTFLSIYASNAVLYEGAILDHQPAVVASS